MSFTLNPHSTSYTPGYLQSPEILTNLVPVDSVVPNDLYHSPPLTITLTAEQSVSTLFTIVGISRYPFSTGKGGLSRGSPRFPSADSINADSSLDTSFYFRLGGDGFETAWNHQDSGKILASVYYNQVYRSINSGRTWTSATEDLITGENDAPFITRLTPVPSNNNIVFAVGLDGVYKTASFTVSGWRRTSIGAGWSGPFWNQVEVSFANEQIVWAGAGMFVDAQNNIRLFVSTDQGDHFTMVNNPQNPVPAYSSGIATHPAEDSTAYVLFGVFGYPKILRTEDLGEHWEDITQVDAEGVSANGFPDVSCWSLFVFPDNTDRIWAGTDIGIMESNDNGDTWHYLTGFPAVPVWQIFIRDNQIVTATYGRGIMTYQYGEPVYPSGITEEPVANTLFTVYPNPSEGIIHIKLPDILQAGRANIGVYTLHGKMVYSNNSTTRNTKELSVNLSSFERGVYLVTVRTDTELFTQRIVLE